MSQSPESETLRDKFGNEIHLGDTLLYPQSGRYGSISVLEVTGIKMGYEEGRNFERVPHLHLFGRPAGSNQRPVWLHYPDNAVNITGTEVVTHYNLWKGRNS